MKDKKHLLFFFRSQPVIPVHPVFAGTIRAGDHMTHPLAPGRYDLTRTPSATDCSFLYWFRIFPDCRSDRFYRSGTGTQKNHPDKEQTIVR
jgi:hypothetical protein